MDIKRESEFCRFKDQKKEEGTSSPVASEVQEQNPLVRRVASDATAGNPSLVLQELFKKANPEELRALETVFRDVTSSSNARQVALLLSKEIRTRQH